RSAEAVRPGRRGAPIGVRPGDPRDGSRLDLLATLRAAVPWQRLRPPPADGARLAFRRDDLRVRIHADRPETLTVFIVDASGSQALRRLAEAKGAVERLLAESYVERARVALVMFRGRAADVALAPTRSLVRARRVLAGVPGGGTTPLAAGIEAGARLATAALREDTPTRLLLLTDGRANIARDGATGRGPAEADALAAARSVRRIGVATAVVDTSPRGQPFTVRLAEELGGTRAWLPAAHSSDLCRVLDHVTRDPGTPG
ncbi:MAG: VWA domain-containing protein, partial [Gemmatimonadota bacterium]